jgi:hypothetical protein
MAREIYMSFGGVVFFIPWGSLFRRHCESGDSNSSFVRQYSIFCYFIDVVAYDAIALTINRRCARENAPVAV